MLSDAARVLLLLPVLVLVLVRLGSTNGWALLPSRRVLFGVCMGLLVAGAALAIYGNARSVRGTYIPAHVVDGRVVPGQ